MNINKTNYGAWFLDYYEGTLSVEKTAELFLFLEQHPDLKEEFDAFSPLTLDISDEVSFPDKDQLRRSSLTTENIDNYLVAELENDLSLQDRVTLKKFIEENPGYKKDRELYRLVKLQPGEEKYPGKKSLRRKVVQPFYFNARTWVAAAAIILAIGIFYINRPEQNTGTAQVNPVKPKDDTLKNFFNSGVEYAGTEQEKKNDSVSPDKITQPEQRFANHSDPTHNNRKQRVPSSNKEDIQNTYADRKHVNHPSEKESIQNTYADRKELIPINREKKSAPQIEREYIQLAEMKGITSTPSIEGDVIPAPEMYAANSSGSDPKGKLGNKLDELKDLAAEKVNEATGDEILYSSDELADAQSEKIPLKSRVIKLVAWTLGKVSGDRIKMDTTFDQAGNIAAYEVSAGKFKYEKDF